MEDGEEESAKSEFSPDKTYQNLPLIVIAGRPNVGKSTLFNALTHTFRAITNPTPGVTRDGVEGVCFIAGHPVRLADTGGYKLSRSGNARDAEADRLAVEKTLASLARADRILLLLDGTEDITPEDEDLISRLRRYREKTVVAVNKTESDRAKSDAYNYLRYGFDDITLISAKQGTGLEALSKKLVEGLDFSRVTEAPEEELPLRIAILGKPNTGKSTLCNALTHTDTSIVSPFAGTTRDVVEGSFRWNGRSVEIFDTAGIRRRAKVKEDVEYYSVNRAIKTVDECDIAFIIIDATELLSEQDKKITALAFDKGRGVIFVLNKWDLKEDRSAKAERAAKAWIQTMFAQMSWAPIVTLSALNGDGIGELMNTAYELYGELTKRIETSVLNAALSDWTSRFSPPASRAGRFKVRYMTQTGTNPVSFIVFATRPDAVPESYKSYLKNRIREDLGFAHIPIQLEFRASRTDEATRRSDR